MTNLCITSADNAKSWQRDVQQLNEETKELLEKLGKTLMEVKKDADSTVVDDIYEYGNQIVDGTTKVFEGMNQILSTVDTILQEMNKVLDMGKETVRNIITGIAGL